MTAGAVGARQEPDSTTGCDATDASKPANLAVRVLLELCAPATLGGLGARTRSRLLTKVPLGVGAPCPCQRIDVRTAGGVEPPAPSVSDPTSHYRPGRPRVNRSGRRGRR